MRGRRVFLSTFEKQLDSKRRIVVPQEFRAFAQSVPSAVIPASAGFDGVYCFPAFEADCLEAGGPALLDRYAKIMTELDFGDPLRLALETSVLGEMRPLSFDTAGSLSRARRIIQLYQDMGVGKERVLIKLASTWEGAQACQILQAEGIDCNMTLLFSLAQAVACAQANAFLISPFVGRILDWHVKASGRTFEPEEDPGVLSVRQIYAYYKAHGINTVVMGASFRSLGEIEALAGCDRLTIAPALLDELAKDEGTLTRKLDHAQAAALAPAKMSLDEKTFRLLMNEDAMASEKLSEGIRLFTKDLRSLRELVARRMEDSIAAGQSGPLP